MPRGRPKGQPKTGGRQRGTKNHVTVEVQAVAQGLVDNPQYRAKLKSDLVARKVSPPVELMLWHYAFGRPKEQLDITAHVTTEDITEKFRGVPTQELKANLLELAAKL